MNKSKKKHTESDDREYYRKMIRKTNREHKHIAEVIMPEWELKGQIWRIVRRADSLGEHIVRFLRRYFDEPIRCSGCGGILPDLQFSCDDGRTYTFTCWKITEKGKVLFETDYEKMGRYCQTILGKNGDSKP